MERSMSELGNAAGPAIPLRPPVAKISFVRTVSWAMVLVSFLSRNAPAADTTAFAKECATCHQRASTLARGLEGENAESRSAALAKFLQTHHSGDAQTRAAIVEYLVGLSMQ